MLLHSASKLLQFLWTFTAQSETHTQEVLIILAILIYGKKEKDIKDLYILE